MRVLALSVLALVAGASASNIRSPADVAASRNLRSKADVERDLALRPKSDVPSQYEAWRRAVSANGTVDSCPGYDATKVKTTSSSLTASLKLAGAACNVYGPDLAELTLEVTYETCESLAAV